MKLPFLNWITYKAIGLLFRMYLALYLHAALGLTTITTITAYPMHFVVTNAFAYFDIMSFIYPHPFVSHPADIYHYTCVVCHIVMGCISVFQILRTYITSLQPPWRVTLSENTNSFNKKL